MFQIIEQVVGNAVVSSGISYEALCAILIGSLWASKGPTKITPGRSWPLSWAAQVSLLVLLPGGDPA